MSKLNDAEIGGYRLIKNLALSQFFSTPSRSLKTKHVEPPSRAGPCAKLAGLPPPAPPVNGCGRHASAACEAK